MQIPQAITTNSSEFAGILPVEIAGWFLRKEMVADGAWILVVTDDKAAKLAGSLIIRGGKGFNVVCGLSDVQGSAEALETLSKDTTVIVLPLMRSLDSLIEVSWDLHRHCFASGGRDVGAHGVRGRGVVAQVSHDVCWQGCVQ